MLNWLTRYVPAAAAVLDDAGSILDVGCGPHGLACLAPDVPFTGADVAFNGVTAPSMVPVVLELGPLLPFPDASFHTVLCLDVLEHVPPGERKPFIAELARVSARRVVLACPSAAAQGLDDLLRSRMGRPYPSWLVEHGDCGLPTDAELDALIRGTHGFKATPMEMPNGLLCTMIVLADLDPDIGRDAAAAFRAHGRDWARVLGAANFGRSFRAGWVLERTAPLSALVPGGLDRSGLAAAVGRLGRGASAAAAGSDDLVCAVPAGAVAEVAPLRTDADLRLWLSPSWGSPETWLGALARYISDTRPEDSTCLCLDARAGNVDLVYELAAIACQRLSGEGHFGDVLIVDGPVDTTGTIAVGNGDDVLAALAQAEGAIPDDPAQIAARARLLKSLASDPADVVARARRGKALADDLRGIADLYHYTRAADPWRDPEPLVTVRIPTWKGHERLVSRTIASILQGTYANVEVLVCSDGPDPAARAAVQALAATDERVRYLELSERPNHPSHPSSFWETTGLRAANHALDHARGDFIAPLDHDDEFTATHIADLLGRARETGADFVHAQALCEPGSGPSFLVGEAPLAYGRVCHGAVLYSSRLAHLRYDPACWLIGEPGDWNMWRRMAALGADVAYLDRVVLVRSREGTSIEERVGDRTVRLGKRRRSEDLAPDVLGTDAARYLDVTFAREPIPLPA